MVSRLKRPRSAHSSVTQVPKGYIVVETTTRLDSVLRAVEEDPSASHNKPLLELPRSVSLPQQEDLEEFDIFTLEAIDFLSSIASGSQQDVATAALGQLAHISNSAACVATSWAEFWAMLTHAAELLCTSLPNPNVSMTNVIMRALESVLKRWNEEEKRGRGSTAEIARVAGETFEEAVRQRGFLEDRVGEAFALWLAVCNEEFRGRSYLDAEPTLDPLCASTTKEILSVGRTKETILRVLTPTPSPMILTALAHTLSSLPQHTIHLLIIAPQNEVAETERLCRSLPSVISHLQTTIYPISKIGSASLHIDMLLLDADRIDANGDIQSVSGALAAAACVRSLSPHATVLVLSGKTSITVCGTKQDEGTKQHSEGVGCESTSAGKAGTTHAAAIDHSGRNVERPFEWVPARFVDVYIGESGVLERAELRDLAREASELEESFLPQGNN